MQVFPQPQSEQYHEGAPIQYPQNQQYQGLLTEGQRDQQQSQIPPQVIVYQIVQQLPIYQVSDLTARAMQVMQISNQVIFEHVFERKTPCCGSEWSEKSIFDIAGLGRLWMGDEYRRHQCCRWKWVPRQARRQRKYYDGRGHYNNHFFAMTDYVIENEFIEMDYWGRIGNIIVGGIPLLQFQTSRPNMCDVLYAHCRVGYPKVVMYFLLEPQKKPLTLLPDISQCPETVLGACGELALCGVCTTERNFTVDGLIGPVPLEILEHAQACAKAYLLQGICCYPHVDYPHFQVDFDNNVLPVDRLAILLALVHYNIIKKWYVIQHITRSTAGVA